MIKKYLRAFFVICTIAGFVILIGTAGSSDLGRIDIQTTLIQNLIGLGILSIGFAGSKAIGSK